MTAEVSHGAATREPVLSGNRRIPGLYARTRADGSTVYGVALRGIPVQVNVLATMLFVITAIAIGLVIWQQRRAERMAEVLPDPEVPEPARPAGLAA